MLKNLPEQPRAGEVPSHESGPGDHRLGETRSRDPLAAEPATSEPATGESRFGRFRGPQISLLMLFLIMMIFAVISAGLLYASRVPAVREEWAALTGMDPIDAGAGEGRTAHLFFILFTLTAPLLLAGVLSTGVAILRRVASPR